MLGSEHRSSHLHDSLYWLSYLHKPRVTLQTRPEVGCCSPFKNPRPAFPNLTKFWCSPSRRIPLSSPEAKRVSLLSFLNFAPCFSDQISLVFRARSFLQDYLVHKRCLPSFNPFSPLFLINLTKGKIWINYHKQGWKPKVILYFNKTFKMCQREVFSFVLLKLVRTTPIHCIGPATQRFPLQRRSSARQDSLDPPVPALPTPRTLWTVHCHKLLCAFACCSLSAGLILRHRQSTPLQFTPKST